MSKSSVTRVVVLMSAFFLMSAGYVSNAHAVVPDHVAATFASVPEEGCVFTVPVACAENRHPDHCPMVTGAGVDEGGSVNKFNVWNKNIVWCQTGTILCGYYYTTSGQCTAPPG